MAKINNVRAREILDSRGRPTVEVEVFCEDGSWGRASVPSGASVGQYEALEKRDNDPARFKGLGVLTAVKSVNDLIGPKIKGLEAIDQRQIDETLIYLDNTPNKSNLGANSVLGVSLASARAAAFSVKMPLYKYLSKLIQTETTPYHLPIPFSVLISGGKHGHDNTDFQEYMVAPIGAKTVKEAIRWCSETSMALAEILKSKGQSTNFGDEGGFTPALTKNIDGVDYLNQAIKNAGYEPGRDISIAIDVAATELFQKDHYRFGIENRDVNYQELIDYYSDMIDKYPVFSIEDGLADADWENWIRMTAVLGKKVKLVGDDVFATNSVLLGKGVSQGVANALIIKPNQVGTLLETIQTIRLAQNAGYLTIISHRAGETEDTFIADLAVAINSFGIKTGAMNCSDRLAKYNQLIRIEEGLGENGRYGVQLNV